MFLAVQEHVLPQRGGGAPGKVQVRLDLQESCGTHLEDAGEWVTRTFLSWSLEVTFIFLVSFKNALTLSVWGA